LAPPHGDNLLQAEAGVFAMFDRFQEYERGYILRVHSLFVFYFGLSLGMRRLFDLIQRCNRPAPDARIDPATTHLGETLDMSGKIWTIRSRRYQRKLLC